MTSLLFEIEFPSFCGAFPKKECPILLLKLTNWRDLQIVIFQFSQVVTISELIALMQWGTLGPNRCQPDAVRCENGEVSMRCSRPKCRPWRPERELQREVAFEVHKE